MAALAYATVMAFLFVHGRTPRHRAEAAWFIAAGIALVVMAITSNPSPLPKELQADGRRARPIALGLFVSASLALYFPVLSTGLFSDDFVLIDRASSGLLTMGTEFFRPLPMLVWAGAAQLGDTSAVVLHAVNVCVHGLNAWLVYLIAREIGLTRGWSIAAAALFLASASSVEAVTWISALFDVLMLAGVLTYVLACLKARHVMALAGLAIALLSKETGVVAALLGFLVAASGRRSLRIPFIGVALTVVFTGVRILLLPPPDTYFATPSRYALKELLSRSFGALGLPWTAFDMAAYPWLTALPWLALAVLMATAVVARVSRRSVAMVFALMAWVIASVLPAYQYFYVSPALEGSRYLYLGTAAFSLLLTTLAATAPAGPPKILAVTALVAASASGTVGVLVHQRAWVSAALQRESVLRAARENLPSANCPSVSVNGLPDSYEGAYVFRNGFREALRMYRIDVTALVATDAACEYEWTGSQFVRRK